MSFGRHDRWPPGGGIGGIVIGPRRQPSKRVHTPCTAMLPSVRPHTPHQFQHTVKWTKSDIRTKPR